MRDRVFEWLRGLVALVVGLPRRLAGYLVAVPGRIASYLHSLASRTAAVLRALPGRAWQFLLDLPGRVWGLLVATKRTVVGKNPEPAELLLGIVTTLTLVGVVGTFVFADDLVAYPLVAFVLAVVVGWVTYQARIAKILTLVATVGTVLTVGFITYFLFKSAWPALEELGVELLMVPTGREGEVRWFFGLEGVLPRTESVSGWNPSSGLYSLIPAIWSTVVVTIIAGAIAAPLGILGALFIAEIAGDRLREIIKPAIEILAGIPSIVYGFIGFQVLNSFIQDSFLDGGASFLIAGIVVGVMALPTVVSVAEDAISSVPASMRDGAIAMGATEWQTMKSISVPAAFSGISAAVILGLGRAIGETMAVAAIMAAGTNLAFPLWDVFDQGVTLTSRIATSYGSASESTLEVLFVAGVLLFLIVASMSVVAQYVERRMKRKLKGQQ